MICRFPRHAASLSNSSNATLASSSDAEARLDNRPELAKALDIAPTDLPSLSDSALILLAYKQWGLNTPDYLCGDFSFALYDAENDWIFCARDHLGIEPFYFYLSDTLFTCASETSELVEQDAVPDTLCDEAVARFLRDGELRHSRLTFFDGVKKLPPAHALVVDKDGLREWRYWKIEDCPPVRLPSLQDYSDTLRELLKQAVASRVPPNEPVAVHLSGGLDSSAIAALASQEAAKCDSSVVGYSWLTAPTGPKHEDNVEWAGGIAVAKRYDIPLRYSEFNSGKLLQVLETLNIASGDNVDSWYEFAVRESAKTGGSSVLLSGWGGDELITHYGNQRYAETFWGGQPLATLRDLWRASTSNGKRLWVFLGMAYKELLRPLFPTRVDPRQVLSQYLGTATDSLVEQAQQLPLEACEQPRFSVRDSQLTFLKRGHILNRVESWAASGRRAGIQYRYPLLDKRVVEFALGIPADMYRRAGHPRYIFRHAISDIVPEEVWGAIHKDEPNRIEEAVKFCIEALSAWHEKHSAQLGESPYIDTDKLVVLLERISRTEPKVNRNLVMDINTAIKSIQVLHLSADHS